MKLRSIAILVSSAAILLVPSSARPQGEGSAQPESDPLAPFERVVGGQWHLQSSYQEFEWGVGRKSVKSRGYFMVGDEPKLVSEGFWFWHPGRKEIRGIFTAIDMPVVLFDMTTRFDGTTMINDLRSYGPDGNETSYVESWEFTDDSHYEWKLLRNTPEGLKQEMGGTYTRR